MIGKSVRAQETSVAPTCGNVVSPVPPFVCDETVAFATQTPSLHSFVLSVHSFVEEHSGSVELSFIFSIFASIAIIFSWISRSFIILLKSGLFFVSLRPSSIPFN